MHSRKRVAVEWLYHVISESVETRFPDGYHGQLDGLVDTATAGVDWQSGVAYQVDQNLRRLHRNTYMDAIGRYGDLASSPPEVNQTLYVLNLTLGRMGELRAIINEARVGATR